MKTTLPIFILLFLPLGSCKTESKTSDIEKWKAEIRQVETDFAQRVKDEGIHDAFVSFAAEDAVLNRGRLIIGKAAIDDFLKSSTSKSLSWSPDYVEVSYSGDLGYTYGSYIYKYVDSLGNPHEDKGIFHTVWKRQTDGSWKFVWD